MNLQLPEINFITKDEIMNTNKIENINSEVIMIDKTKFVKMGHWRGDYCKNQGMLIKWYNGPAFNIMINNRRIQTEAECIMERIKQQIFPNYESLYNGCVQVVGYPVREAKMLGFGPAGCLYMLHMIPRKGDYNVYLHTYVLEGTLN